MPVSKSAIREMRAAARKEIRNKTLTSLGKTNVVKAEKALKSGDADAAKGAVATAISTLDRAAERGNIHRNNAARRKSRLAKKLNAIKAAPAKKE